MEDEGVDELRGALHGMKVIRLEERCFGDGVVRKSLPLRLARG